MHSARHATHKPAQWHPQADRIGICVQVARAHDELHRASHIQRRNPLRASGRRSQLDSVRRLHPSASDCAMSRAFLRDDAEGEMPRRHYGLPPRDDPDYDRASARALLDAARVNETQLAERATGYYWGEPALRPHVEAIRAAAEASGDDRLEQLARRFLR
jgi:hypothetical protein